MRSKDKICVSIAKETAGDCLSALKGLALAEIRLDRMTLSEAEIRTIFSQPLRLVATCRPGFHDDEKRKWLLLSAIEGGSSFVDIELESTPSFKQDIVKAAESTGCRAIVSFHDFTGTPDREDLRHIVEQCFQSGADVAKVACLVRQDRDNVRLLALLDDSRQIIVTGMGEKGRITRILAPLLGSPFTYASVESGLETAPGQMDLNTVSDWMEKLRRV